MDKKYYYKKISFILCIIFTFFLVATPASADDWSSFQKDEHNSGVTDDSAPISAPDSNSWQTSIASGWGGNCAHIIVDDVVYAMGSGLYAVELETGNVLWKAPCSFGYVMGAPAYGDGTVYAPSANGKVYAVDAKTGKIKWNVSEFSGQLNCHILYDEHRIYFGECMGGHKYYCYDENGKEVWNRTATTRNSGEGSYYLAGAAVIGDYLVYGDDDGNIVSVNKENGSTVDEIVASNDIGSGIGTIRSSPCYRPDTGRIYFSSRSGHCFYIGFDSETGTFDTSRKAVANIGYSTSAPAVNEDRVYVGRGGMTASGGVVCLDADTMEIIWETDEGIIQASPAVCTHYDDVYIYVTANGNQGLICLKDAGDKAETVFKESKGQTYLMGGAAISNGYVVFGSTFLVALTTEEALKAAKDPNWHSFHKDPQNSGNSPCDAPESGNLLWASEAIGAAQGSSLVIADGKVYAYNVTGPNGWTVTGAGLITLNAETGAIEAEEERPVPTIPGWDSPCYYEGEVYINTMDVCDGSPLAVEGKLIESNWTKPGNYTCKDLASGEVLWTFEVKGNAQASPAYLEGRVYLTSTGAKNAVYCVDLATGEEVWNYSAGFTEGRGPAGSVSLSESAAYFCAYNTAGNGGVYALDLSDGHELWSNLSIVSTDCTPAVADGRIYVCGGCKGVGAGKTYCFEADTGENVWETNASENIGSWTCSPAFADNMVFVGKLGSVTWGSGSDGLYALDADTGEVVWYAEKGGSSPAIAEDCVFTIGEDGRVYAYGDVEADFKVDIKGGNVPLKVSFEDKSDFTGTSWAWNFGDGDSSTEQNPVHIYQKPGRYNVSLNVSNGFCYSRITKENLINAVDSSTLWEGEITVLEEAQFSQNTSGGKEYKVEYTTPVGVLNEVSKAGLSYNMSATEDWGGTSFKLEAINGIANEAGGSYAWVLYVNGQKEDDYCKGLHEGDQIRFYYLPGEKTAEAKYIVDVGLHINMLPVVHFSSNISSGRAPLTVEFNDSSEYEPTAWAWDFDSDGNVDSEVKDPVHTFTEPGEYTVTLKVKNAYGNRTETIKIIAASPLNEIWAGAIFVDGSSFECGGEKIDRATAIGALDLASMAEDFSYEAKKVPLYPQWPQYGSKLAFGGINGIANEGSYRWLILVNGARAEIKTPVHSGDVVKFCYIPYEGNTALTELATQAVSINIRGAPEAGFTCDVNKGKIPLAINFTDSSKYGPRTWEWDFDSDGTVDSTGQNVSHCFTEEGVYTITLTVSNAYGKSSSSLKLLAAGDLETLWEGDAELAEFKRELAGHDLDSLTCLGALAKASEKGGFPLDVEYKTGWTCVDGEWINGYYELRGINGIKNDGDISYTWAAFVNGEKAEEIAGKNPVGEEDLVRYYYIPEDAESPELAVYAINISVKKGILPMANFTADIREGEEPLSVQFTDLSENATAWDWDFDNDGVTDSTEQNPSWTYTQKGEYSVSLAAENSVTAVTLRKEAYISVSGPTYLEFGSEDSSVTKGMEAEVRIIADELPKGLSGYNLTVSLDDPSIAEITGIEFPAWTNPTENSSLFGSSVYLKATDAPLNKTDVIGTVKTGDTDVVLGTIKLLGKETGNVNISIKVNRMDDDSGSKLRNKALSKTFKVTMEAFPDPLCKNSPKDLDGDGIFEDITGNGECTFTDLELYFHYMNWIEKNRPVEAFDFNENGRIDFNDVVLMFEEIQPVE